MENENVLIEPLIEYLRYSVKNMLDDMFIFNRSIAALSKVMPEEEMWRRIKG